MAPICVLVTQQNELLDRALVDMLLSPKGKHELITSSAQNLDELLTDVSNQVPNVILIGESTPLATRDTLIPLLMAYPILRVIVVSEDTNWLHIFSKKDLLLTQTSDLLNLIDSE